MHPCTHPNEKVMAVHTPIHPQRRWLYTPPAHPQRTGWWLYAPPAHRERRGWWLYAPLAHPERRGRWLYTPHVHPGRRDLCLWKSGSASLGADIGSAPSSSPARLTRAHRRLPLVMTARLDSPWGQCSAPRKARLPHRGWDLRLRTVSEAVNGVSGKREGPSSQGAEPGFHTQSHGGPD